MLAATFMLQGCETMQGTWASTKAYYKEYINVDPQVDLAKKDYSTSEERVAALFTPVDKHLESLSIYLNRQDRLPGEKWIDGLFEEYPWVNGLAAATLDGEVILQRPDATMKPLDISPLLGAGEELRDRNVRSYVDETPLGPEVYLGTALFNGNDLAGIVSVHFDMRSVVRFCPEPDQLIAFTPDAMLWTGADKASAEKLFTMPWEETLKQQTSGSVTLDGRQFAWLSRFLGDHQVVYAVETLPDEETADSGSFWDIF